MGLTIHYEGKLKQDTSLPDLIEEVKNIAEVHQWEYHIYETDFPSGSLDKEEFDGKIYGIHFTPPECESVQFTFLSNGRTGSDIGLKIFGDKDMPEHEYLYWLFTKTQFVGPKMHKFIVHLFRYMADKYFDEFNVEDETDFWKTGDEEKLNELFGYTAAVIEGFRNAFDIFEMQEGESLEAYITRLMNRVLQKSPKSED